MTFDRFKLQFKLHGERKGKIMNMDLIFRIAAIGVLVSILNSVLKQSGREELAMLTTLSGLILVLIMVAREIVNLFNMVRAMFNF